MERIDLIPKYIIACCVLHNICLLKDDEFPDLLQFPSVDENVQGLREMVAIRSKEQLRGKTFVINYLFAIFRVF